jgi:uncharacterized protein YkwD
VGEQTHVPTLSDAESATDDVSGGRARTRRRPNRRTVLAVIVVGALVVAGGVAGGVAWAEKSAHDGAVAEASDAHALATDAAERQRDAVRSLESAVADGTELRDAVASQVLPNAALLGGEPALAPVSAAHTELAAVLTGAIGGEEPAGRLTDAAPREAPARIDPAAGTDELRELAEELTATADETDAERTRLADRTSRVVDAVEALDASLTALAGGLTATHEALVSGHPLASADTTTQATAALSALGDPDPAQLPELFAAYASAASALVAAHDAEAARIAAEQAAQEAARRGRSTGGGSGGGSGGGGGSVTGASEQRGVLGETNAQRAANGVGGLAWNGTLASRSCSFAAELASRNGDLYHSSFGGGFSTWGENVASGYGSVSAVVAGWMGSSGHRANILNGAFTMMGACSSTSATGRIYWVQQFGG